MGLLKSIICCVQAVFGAMFGEIAENFKGIEDIKGLAQGKTKKEIASEELIITGDLADQIGGDAAQDKATGIINDIKTLMPEEVNQAIWINTERQRIITEAKAEADLIIEQANQEAQIKAKEGEQFEENLKQQFDDIVESNEMVERAKARATEIISRAESYAIEIREGSIQYAEDVISSVEQNLLETLEIVKRNKREFKE